MNNLKKWMLCVATLITSYQSQAQAPTALAYPTPNVFIANISNVYLAPTVAGNVSSYSITSTPSGTTLPAGLGFNTNTGIISGIPTAALSATKFVVTATGGTPAGSTTDTISIAVTNNFFDNSYSNINFGGTGVNIISKVKNGANAGWTAGDIMLYENVASPSGQRIDAIVKTKSITGGNFTNYDATGTGGGNYPSNEDRFFSPLFDFNNTGGSAAFDFQFILGGTYDNATNTGVPVVLQNVQINTYDIDGNASNSENGSNQYNDFGGFTTSTLGNPTRIVPTLLSSGLTHFRSNSSINIATVTDPRTRVRVTYSNISDFSIVVGSEGGGAAYFFLEFGTGPTFSTAVNVSAPSIDLNTSKLGVNNDTSNCGIALPFTAAGQTNLTTDPTNTTLNNFTLSFPTTDIKDGNSEQLLINGATAGSPITLSTANGTLTNVAMSGITYKVVAATSNDVKTLTFTNNAGGSSTISATQAETLLDALRYNNTATLPTAGGRKFTLQVANSAFLSPSAVFTATLSCVGLSGNIWHDANGLSDSTVNANAKAGGPQQFSRGNVFAVMVNPVTNRVIDTVSISNGGAYAFGKVTPGTYDVYVSATKPAINSTFTAATFPAGYKPVGENLDANPGNDLIADGKLRITVGSVTVNNANFGLQIPPTATSTVYNNLTNPGGFNNYMPSVAAFNTSDTDGTVDNIIITSFPTGANYLKVDTRYYTNPSGGSCPPQVTCTTWPGTLTVPAASISTIAVDPTATGATSVVIPYRAVDNAGVTDLNVIPATVTLNFVDQPSAINLSGNVWNDANGNGIINAGENNTNVANTDEVLYAILVQTSSAYSNVPTVYATTPVTAGGTYSFTNVPAGNNYELHIVSRKTTARPADGTAYTAALVAPNLATGWRGVSTNDGTANGPLNTLDPTISIINLRATKTDLNIGIERVPVADNKAFIAPNTAFTGSSTVRIGGQPTFYTNSNNESFNGSAVRSLSGSDAEDCATASSCASGKTYMINSIKANTRLFYDFGGTTGLQEVTLLANNTITKFDAAKLFIYGQAGQGNTDATALGFTYSLVDAAGVPSAPATYSLKSSSTALPVKLVRFTGTVNQCTATLNWETATEENSSYFAVEQSKDANTFTEVTRVSAKSSQTGASYSANVTDLSAGNYFRLKMVDDNGDFAYSNVLGLKSDCHTNSNITTYPNPVNNELHINGLKSGDVVNVYNSLGTLLISAAQNNQLIPMNNFAPGIYILQVKTATGELIHTARVIKQ